jgi:hypothetical protein
LGALFTQKRHAGLRVHRLPCVEWNCEDESWASFDPARTRIVHFKGELQRALLSKRRPDDEMRPLIEIWKSIESGSEPEPEPIVPPLPDHREIRPEDQDDQMIRPTDVDAPEPPPLSRRQRRRASRPLTGIGDAQ